MIIPSERRLVFLEMPKAARTSITRMRKRAFPDEAIGRDKAERHAGIVGCRQKFDEPLSVALGGPIQTFAVVRDPLDRTWIWYRYGRRDKVRDLTVDTSHLRLGRFL